MARLGALGALADLADGNDLLNEVPSTINYEDLVNSGSFNSSRNEHRPIKSEQKWLGRATSELLDLSSGDSRGNTPQHETDFTQNQQSLSSNKSQQSGEAGLIPQIVMNPWDPNQTPVMTLAPLANAMQAYQQQWLSMQAAAQEGSEEDEDKGPKSRVLCLPPDEEMGFLSNLPPPCNVLLQPSTVGISGKPKPSGFLTAFEKFLRGTFTLLAF